MCGQQKAAFGDPDDHEEKGGLKAMGESMARGQVLVMSMWDDHDAHMLWLDGDFPLGSDPGQPGVSRGSCPPDSGVPADMEADYPGASITFMNIRFGELGSTYPGGEPPHPAHLCRRCHPSHTEAHQPAGTNDDHDPRPRTHGPHPGPQHLSWGQPRRLHRHVPRQPSRDLPGLRDGVHGQVQHRQ